VITENSLSTSFTILKELVAREIWGEEFVAFTDFLVLSFQPRGSV